MNEGLRAGVGRSVITPPLGTSLLGLLHDRKAEDVEDELYAKALVLDDGQTPIAIVLLDVITILAQDVAQIRQLVEEHTHIPGENVLVACTHTHTGPATFSMAGIERDEAYCAWMVKRAADSVRLAVRPLQPALAAGGVGQVEGISFCRRFLMADGTVRCNPGANNPDVRHVMGTVDPQVGVLYVETADGVPLATVANFSLHYVGTDNSLAVSADYFGHFERVMQRVKGADFTAMLMNGAQGHTNNVNIYDPARLRGSAQARRVAETLAGEVMGVIGRLKPEPHLPLGVETRRLTFKRKEVTEDDVRIAHEILAGSGATASGDAGPVGDGPGPFSWVVGHPIPPKTRPVYALETIEVSKLPLHLETELQVLRVGDTAIIGLPGEFFAEIGLDMKARSRAAHTFVVGLANDFIGYVPTDEALREQGGYETWTSRWSLPDVGTGKLFTDAATDMIAKLFE